MPQVSVVIPTKNRRELLGETVASILGQNLELEIIVLDDGSTDGTCDWLRQRFPFAQFPNLRIERFARSKGPTLRRNQGARLARGEWLFTIDDDCTLPHQDTLARTVAAFDDARVGAVTIPFINVRKPDKSVLTAAPDETQTYAAFDYYGGMIAFRRALYLRLGGYRPFYFMNVEESDLAVRILDAGFFIKLGVAPPLDHHESPVRVSKRINELGPRNNILYAWYNVPMPFLLPHILGAGFLAVRHIWRVGFPGDAVRGWFQGWAAVAHELRHRRPVSVAGYQLSREIKARGAVPLGEIEARLKALKTRS